MKASLNTTTLIQLLLVLLLILWCFLIVQPFLLLLVWAVLLGVTLFPVYNTWLRQFGPGRRKWATFFFTLALAVLLFVPTYYLTAAIVEGTRATVEQIRQDSLQIPQPEPSVKDWPLIGEQLYVEWKSFADNAQQYAADHKDVILETGRQLLSSLGGFFGSLLVLVLAFFIAVVFMFNAERGYHAGSMLFNKLLGERGEEFLQICRDTIRSVVKGILLVAVIQALLALLGFEVVGLPGAGIFTLLVLVFAIVQLPVWLVMIPAIIMVFSMKETTPAVIFTVYSIIVSLSDSFLKPIFLGKGLKTPVIIILIGSIGGLLLHGIIGLFVGAVILAVGHQLYMYWITSGAAMEFPSEETDRPDPEKTLL